MGTILSDIEWHVGADVLLLVLIGCSSMLLRDALVALVAPGKSARTRRMTALPRFSLPLIWRDGRLVRSDVLGKPSLFLFVELSRLMEPDYFRKVMVSAHVYRHKWHAAAYFVCVAGDHEEGAPSAELARKLKQAIVLRDGNGRLAKRLEVRVFPSACVFDDAGRLLDVGTMSSG